MHQQLYTSQGNYLNSLCYIVQTFITFLQLNTTIRPARILDQKYRYIGWLTVGFIKECHPRENCQANIKQSGRVLHMEFQWGRANVVPNSLLQRSCILKSTSLALPLVTLERARGGGDADGISTSSRDEAHFSSGLDFKRELWWNQFDVH